MIHLVVDGKTVATAETPFIDNETGSEYFVKAKKLTIMVPEGENSGIESAVFNTDKSSDLIPYSIDEPEYDMSTFTGRFLSSLRLSNPTNAFQSNEKIRYFQQLIQHQKDREAYYFQITGSKKMMMERAKVEELRLAQSVISTSVNPESGKIIFWTMRMSSFLPLNIPINFGLIVTPPSPFNTILWNWINQTYSAQCNYGNRNASSKYTVKTIIKSYVAACMVSISIALFSRHLVSKWTAGMSVGGMMLIFNSITSYLSCASAGFCNVLMMRYSELVNGISVYDPAD